MQLREKFSTMQVAVSWNCIELFIITLLFTFSAHLFKLVFDPEVKLWLAIDKYRDWDSFKKLAIYNTFYNKLCN